MKLQDLVKKLEHRFNKKMIITNNQSDNDLKIIGITGSRGKSSTAYIIHKYLKLLGYKSALYSSILIDCEKSKYKNNLSVDNPMYDENMLIDAIQSAINSKCQYLILEVNERAISKGLAKNIDFDVKLLTNIVPKQNDYYDDYVQLKKSFISSNDNAKKIVAVIDDDTRKLYYSNKDIISICTKHIKENKMSLTDKIDYLLVPSKLKYCTINGLDFIIRDNKNMIDIHIKSNMCMPFHGLNIICAYTVLKELNVDLSEFSNFIKNVSIPGRDEVINYGNNKIIISTNMVPHLENLKQYQKSNEVNNIYLLVGSTGYGFRGWDNEFSSEKYIKVHEYDIKFAYDYATKYADKIYITLTDIGMDEFKQFLEYQETLVKGKVLYEVIPNRKQALKTAIEHLNNNDVLFVSGRGNREVMSVDSRNFVQFSDKENIEKIIKGDKNDFKII